ncbi:hypothetical protein WN944_000284 [Citrus x changshan-huyou]|uniref:Uncharacterized protein n=1 Tax=Citrus x changshan-huyou TaxID=2935761 RepID=A0AAP0ME96_9ROSI
MGRKQLKAPARLMVRGDHFLNYQKRYLDNYFLTVPPRDAVRTSITSKRWRYIWTCHSDLISGAVMKGVESIDIDLSD